MKALIVVDIQNDFLPGGALGVDQGDQIIPAVNKLMALFELVVATQDWHPVNHESFASNHIDRKIGEVVDLYGLNQVLWPDHCVENSQGAELASQLNVALIDRVFRKGTNPRVDSYSGFFDNGKKNDTGLNAFLQSHKVTQVFIVGLATDYCVKYTAMDAVNLGFETTVIMDAVKSVNLHPNDQEQAIDTMKRAGVKTINSHDVISLP